MGPLSAAGLWSKVQSTCHINHLKLETVFFALQQFLPSSEYNQHDGGLLYNQAVGAGFPMLSKAAEHVF